MITVVQACKELERHEKEKRRTDRRITQQTIHVGTMGRDEFRAFLQGFKEKTNNFYVSSDTAGSQFEVFSRDPVHLQKVVEKLFKKSGSKIITPEATK